MSKTKLPHSYYERISPSNPEFNTESKIEKTPAGPKENLILFWGGKKEKNLLPLRVKRSKLPAYIIKVFTLKV